MGRRETEYYWMKVTLDEYELPLIVANTREELAKLAKVKIKTISEEMSRAKRTGMKCQYIKIPKRKKRLKKNDRNM